LISGRALAPLHSKLKLSKLFAKHYKVEQHVAYLKEALVRVVIGTPNRILKLCSINSLKLGELKYIIIEASYRDSKTWNIFEIFDCKNDLIALYKNHLSNLVEVEQAKVVLF